MQCAPCAPNGPNHLEFCVLQINLQSFAFNLFDYQEVELQSLVKDCFEKFNLFESFKVPMPMFNSFMSEIRKAYHDNPYHNFRHAFDVCQMLYCFLTLTNATEFLTSLDIFAMLVTSQHGLSSQKMTQITSNCGATRSLSIKWP